MKKIAPYLIFIAAMFWATDAPFRVALTAHMSSNFIVLGEHFFDVLIVAPILWMHRGQMKRLSPKQWLAVVFIAVGGSALASVAFTQAFHYVNPSVAILLQKLQPLIAIGLAASLLGERVSKNFWIWAILALAGAYIISFPSLKPELFRGEVFNPNMAGAGLALLAAVLWGASTVFGKYVLEAVDFKVMTSLRFIAAFIFLAIFNAVEHGYPAFHSVTGKDWLFLFIIAMASGVFSLFMYYRGLQNTQASVATLAELGFPMAAVVVNWLFIPGTALLPLQFLGIVILLFAIFRLGGENARPEEVAIVTPGLES